ncbi:GNAT family N-acetyltransferase [Paenibacillus tengchongensis]|uniref:GNAT family N-acetyltransferase n=1 Tax=Paenibacillus tengchongensis TaxID=2608684 RepID=UPI001FE63903|nr:GNAT family N-acetyltransferase [Paenibacillus tengchongensis]
MQYPVVTQALARRLAQSETDYMLSRMAAIREREGNPEGIEVQTFGQATAWYARTMPWGGFNTVKGLTFEDTRYVDEIIEFYRERGRRGQFEIVPSGCSGELLRALAERGFYQSAFHTTMYGMPRSPEPDFAEGITVREIEAGEFALYGRLHCLGTGLDVSGAPHVAANNQVLFGRPGWRIYLGFVDGAPAGAASMYMHEGVASCTFAATLPEFRRRGLQAAFLQKRMHEAALNHCELVAAQCAYASASQKNMERAGFRIGYTRATWSELHDAHIKQG